MKITGLTEAQVAAKVAAGKVNKLAKSPSDSTPQIPKMSHICNHS